LKLSEKVQSILSHFISQDKALTNETPLGERECARQAFEQIF